MGVDSGSLHVQADSQPKSSGLVLGRRPLGAVLHSSNEPGEFSQWLCHDKHCLGINIIIINCTWSFASTNGFKPVYLEAQSMTKLDRMHAIPFICIKCEKDSTTGITKCH